MWAVRVQIIGLPALLLFGTRFFLFNIFRAIQTPFWAIMLHDEAFFFKIFGNMEKIPTFVLETNRLGNG